MRGKKSTNFILKIMLGVSVVSCGGIIGLAANMDNINSMIGAKEKEEYGDKYKYFLTTKHGRPLTLDIIDHTLSFVFDKSFSEEAKQNARYAVDCLDKVLPNTNMIIYEDDSKPNHNNYINLKLVEEKSLKGGHSAGITHVNYNDCFAKIEYPVEIEIDERYVDEYWSFLENDEPQNSIFSTIVQHEVGHALGLIDLYDKESAKDSVMASNLGWGQRTYSEIDKENLQFVYCKDNSVVSYKATYPQSVVFTPENTTTASYYEDNNDFEM